MKKLLLLSLILVISLCAVVLGVGEFLRPVRGQGTVSNADFLGSYAFNLVGNGGQQIQFSVPGTLDQGTPLSVVPNGTLGAVCDEAPPTPCFQVNFASPTPKLVLPILQPMSVAGTFVADGAGNITSGSALVFDQSLNSTDGQNYTLSDNTCNVTLSGTYSFPPGTMTLNPVPVPGSTCTPPPSITFTLLPGNGIQFGVMYLSAPVANPGAFSSFLNGSFFKQ